MAPLFMDGYLVLVFAMGSVLTPLSIQPSPGAHVILEWSWCQCLLKANADPRQGQLQPFSGCKSLVCAGILRLRFDHSEFFSDYCPPLVLIQYYLCVLHF
jgi:hypothetical protein